VLCIDCFDWQPGRTFSLVVAIVDFFIREAVSGLFVVFELGGRGPLKADFGLRISF